MKINSEIPLVDVVYITKELCKYMTNEDYEVIYIPIKLREDGELKKYISMIACRKEDVEEALLDTAKLDGIDKNDFIINSKYCHIATYLEKDKSHEISFNEEDSCFIKARINSEYEYVDNFFKKFIDFRNDLIRRKQLVKRDDIFQYYCSITGFGNENKKNKRKVLTK